jgi:hypothetical protein
MLQCKQACRTDLTFADHMLPSSTVSHMLGAGIDAYF